MKKIANASFASIPLKSDWASSGCRARSAAATPSTAEGAGGEERDARSALAPEEVEHEQEQGPERERQLGLEPERGAQVFVDERDEDSIAGSLPAYSGRRFWMSTCRVELIDPRIACG